MLLFKFTWVWGFMIHFFNFMVPSLSKMIYRISLVRPSVCASHVYSETVQILFRMELLNGWVFGWELILEGEFIRWWGGGAYWCI